MAEPSKKKSSKRSKSTRSEPKEPQSAPKPKAAPAPKPKAPKKTDYEKLYSLRESWEKSQDVVADRSRAVDRALGITSSTRLRDQEVQKAKLNLAAAKESEDNASRAFLDAKAKARQ